MVHNKREYIVLKFFYLSLLVIFNTACDTTSNAREHVQYEKSAAIRAVFVPYKTQYGPKVAKNMMSGSLNQAPVKSYYKKGEDIPAPSSFGCFQSWVNTNPNSNHNYNYQTMFMYFPASVVKSAHGRYKYVVAEALSPSGPDGKYMGTRKCIMPYIKGVDKMVKAFLKIDGQMKTPDRNFTLKTTSRELKPDYSKKKSN